MLLFTALRAGLVFADEIARAATPTAPVDDLSDLSRVAFEAARGGNWRVLFAAILVLSVYVIRRVLHSADAVADRLLSKPETAAWRVRVMAALAWFKTPKGGAALSLLLGVVGAVGHALLAHQFSWRVVLDGVQMGVLASGGWTVWHKLAAPPTPVIPSEKSGPTVIGAVEQPKAESTTVGLPPVA